MNNNRSLSDVIDDLRVLVGEAQALTARGEVPTPKQHQALSAMAERMKYLRNYSICTTRGTCEAIGRQHGISYARVSQIKTEGIPRIFL